MTSKPDPLTTLVTGGSASDGLVSDAQRARMILIAMLGLTSLTIVLAATHLAWALVALSYRPEISFGEAYVLDEALSLIRGLPLYWPTDQPPAAINLYGPLFYLIIALPQQLAGPSFLPGRLANILFALSSSILVTIITMQTVLNRKMGLLAGYLYLALGFSLAVPWYSNYRVDMLGVLIELASVALLMTPSRGRVILAGLSAGLAFTDKLTFVGAGITGVVWLFIVNRDRLPFFIVPAASVVLLIDGWAQLMTGNLVSNLVVGNAVPFDAGYAAGQYKALFHFLFGPIILSLIYFVSYLKSANRRHFESTTGVVVIYWITSWLCIPELAKAGSNTNYWIELAAASCILSVMLLWSGTRVVTHRLSLMSVPAVVVILVLNLFVTALPTLQSGLPRFSTPAGFDTVLEKAQSETGAVVSDPMDIEVLSGHGPVMQPLLLYALSAANRLDDSTLSTILCGHHVSLLILNYPLDEVSTHPWPAIWPGIMAHWLQASFIFDQQIGSYYLYRSRPESTAGCAESEPAS